MTAIHEVQAPSTQFAGLFQRLLAFLIDGFLLGLVGQVLVLVLVGLRSRAGGWEWTIGFVIVVSYSGVLNSRVGGGQSIGKRIAKIRVVGSDGTPISLGKSVVRAAALSTPYFLFDAPLDLALPLPAAAVVSYVALGMELAIVYLFVFNRPTRQSLHDRLVGTYVVAFDSALAPGTRSLWWGHRAVVVAILVLVVVVQIGARRLGRTEFFASLTAAQQAISKEPGVAYVRMSAQTAINIEDGQRSSRQVLLVRVVLVQEPTNAGAVANRAVRIVLDTAPEAAGMDEITVLLANGYDIGIARLMTTRELSFSPSRWRERMGL
jgi:uncharacterized RDD family membrane protein YckC